MRAAFSFRAALCKQSPLRVGPCYPGGPASLCSLLTAEARRLLTSCTLIDVDTCPKETRFPMPELTIISAASRIIALALALTAALASALLPAQSVPAPSSPPASGGGFFPLAEVRAGMKANAWTVLTGNKPEPMEVEVLVIFFQAEDGIRDWSVTGVQTCALPI